MAMNVDCLQFNLSPLGFHGWADQYLQDYRDVAQSSPDSPASYLLLCRVIELELKAWHRRGTKQNVLADRFRHDLVASYRALPAKQRILSADEVGLLTSANAIYEKQGFDNIGVGRAGASIQSQLDLVGLEAVAQKMIGHGDKLKLAQG